MLCARGRAPAGAPPLNAFYCAQPLREPFRSFREARLGRTCAARRACESDVGRGPRLEQIPLLAGERTPTTERTVPSAHPRPRPPSRIVTDALALLLPLPLLSRSQPHYKLPMCKMYNENSCCAPIHDAETQWAYETLIDVADRCTTRRPLPAAGSHKKIFAWLAGEPGVCMTRRCCAGAGVCST